MIVEYKNAKGQDRKWVLFDRVKGALRSLSYKTPMRAAALKRARIERGKYKCELCGTIGGPKTMAVDHTDPIIPITGFKSWDDTISRLFCTSDKLKTICKKPCHSEKTKAENAERRKHKKS